jgi:hypothetical protein
MSTCIDNVLQALALQLSLPALALADGEGVTLNDDDGVALTIDRDDARDLLHLRLDLGRHAADDVSRKAGGLLQAGSDDLPPPYAFAWDAEAGRLLLAGALPASQLQAQTLQALIDHAPEHRLQAQALLQALAET